ncbi:MAG: hypothetical protein G01um101416_446 [Microgenomates group bacterium Gr01-1014_16]|nr:MAG: hypothetical protein G01um101416_446 [Microgenomates group bacterium Gr01-1014_16]
MSSVEATFEEISELIRATYSDEDYLAWLIMVNRTRGGNPHIGLFDDALDPSRRKPKGRHTNALGVPTSDGVKRAMQK